MDNKDFDYKTRPHSQAKLFNIHSLSQDGFDQYLSSNSHVHNYLDKISSNNFKNFLLKTNQSLNNKSINITILKSPPPEENKEETLSPNNKEQNQLNQINNKNKEEEKKEELEKIKTDYSYKSATNFFPKKNIKIKITDNNIKKPVNMNVSKSNLFIKSNNDLLTRRLNFTSSNFKRTLNPQNSNRYDNSYFSNFFSLTSKNCFKNENKNENTNVNKKISGFKSFNVPRIEKLNLDKNKPMNKLTINIGRSCTGNKKITFESPFSKDKLIEVNQENQKLIDIIKKQNNSNYLKFAKLSHISKSMDIPKLKIKKNQEIEKIKYMGDKYNPYNFQAGRDCEMLGRNHNGGLFNH